MKRFTELTGALVVLLGTALTCLAAGPSGSPPASAPAPGADKTEILGFRVASEGPDTLVLDVDYQYDGKEGPVVLMSAYMATDGHIEGSFSYVPREVVPGRGTVRMTICGARSSPLSLTNQVRFSLYRTTGRTFHRGVFFPCEKVWLCDPFAEELRFRRPPPISARGWAPPVRPWANRRFSDAANRRPAAMSVGRPAEVGAVSPISTQPVTGRSTVAASAGIALDRGRAARTQPGVRRWAIVSSPAVCQWPLGDFLTTRLATMRGVQLVERDRIDAVLRELTFSELLGAEGVAARLRFGRLLQADVLVFLREREREDRQDASRTERRRQRQDQRGGAVEMAVARTDQGVRFLVYEAIWDPEKADETATRLADALGKAKPLSEREDFRLFAVPPFVSRDIGVQYAEKRAAYARLVERLLVRHDGVAVVELAEAQALARELAIGGTTITRNLPYYVYGSYKTAGNGDQVTVALALELRQGETVIAQIKREAVPQVGVSQALEESLNDMLAKVGRKAVPPADLDMEAALLTARGDLFFRIGELDEAMPLYESALLCRPGYRDAHLGLFDGFCILMDARMPGPIRHLPYDPSARIAAAESAMTHLQALVNGERQVPELLGLLAEFRSSFDLLGYSVSGDPNKVVPTYRRLTSAYYEILLRNLADYKSHGMQPGDLGHYAEEVAGSIAWAYSIDPPAAVRRAVALLSLLDQCNHPSCLFAQIHCALDLARSCETQSDVLSGFMGTLEASASPRIRLAAQVARILLGVRDETTQRQAIAQIDPLIADDANHNGTMERIRILSRERLSVSKRELPARAEGGLMLPELTPLDASVRPGGTGTRGRSYPLRVNSWIHCGADLELIAAQDGVYKVTEAGRLEPFLRIEAVNLQWDGRYVWVVGRKSILVVTTEGRELARFDDSELNSTPAESARLQVIAPGRVRIAGAVHTPPQRVRTWVGVLRVDPARDGTLSKHVETLYDGGDAAVEGTTASAFAPASSSSWSVTLPHGGPNGERVLLRGGGSNPWVMDLATGTTRERRQPWPYTAVFAHDGDTVYMATGCLYGRHDGKCQVSRVEKADEVPKAFVELVPSDPVLKSRIPDYYTAMAVHEGRIHLLGRTPAAGQDKETCTWTVLDPAAKRAYVLADPLRREFTSGGQLLSSKHVGLVMLCNGEAFLVKLPPIEQWPSLSDDAPPNDVGVGTRSSPAVVAPAVSVTGTATRILRGHTDPVISVAFSPGGRWAASAGGEGNNSLLLWKLAIGGGMPLLRYADFGGTYAVACSPDGKNVMAAGHNGKMYWGDPRTGDQWAYRYAGGREYAAGHSVRSLSFAPDGSRVLVGCAAGTVQLWDLQRSQPLYEIKAHSSGPCVVAFSHDGRFILSAGDNGGDHGVRLAESRTGAEIRRFTGITSRVSSIAFSPDDQRALSAGWDGMIRLWDVQTGREIRRFQGNRGGVFGVAFLPDGKRFISGGGKQSCVSWFNPDGTPANPADEAARYADNSVRVWDTESGKELCRFQGHTLAVLCVAVSPDGKYALSGSEDRTVRLWTMPAGRAER